jgi:hypothetical protein
MAVINKTGITNGGTVQAEHITRAIDALSSVGTDTIIATGSFSGSLTGIATTASNVAVTDTTTGAGPYYVMFADGTTGNRAVRVDSAALTFNATTNVLGTTASFSSTASFVNPLNQNVAITGSARITGSLGVTGSLSVTGSTTLNGALSGSITGSSTLIMNLSTIGSSGTFILPTTAPSTPTRGSVYWDYSGKFLYIHDGSSWYRSAFDLAG